MATAVDVATDRAFEERFWVVVRFSWAAMTGVLLAAILGFTGGGGPYSSQVLASDSFRVELPAIARWAAADSMTVAITAPTGQATVVVPEGFGETFVFEGINPQPRSVAAGPDGDEFTFDLKPTRAEATIEFSVRAARPVVNRRLGSFIINGVRSEPSSVTVLP